jgi:hypothetical protein
MRCKQPLDIGAGEADAAVLVPEWVDALLGIWRYGSPFPKILLPLRRDLRLGTPGLAVCFPVSFPFRMIIARRALWWGR